MFHERGAEHLTGDPKAETVFEKLLDVPQLGYRRWRRLVTAIGRRDGTDDLASSGTFWLPYRARD